MCRLWILICTLVCTSSAIASQWDDVLQTESELIIAETELLKREQLREQDILQSIEGINTSIESQRLDNRGDRIDGVSNQDIFPMPIEDDPIDIHNKAKNRPLENDEELLLADQVFTFDQLNTKQTKTKKSSDKSVGVQGQEEALINQLDNSDLMDFERELDIWSTDIEIKGALKEEGIDDF